MKLFLKLILLTAVISMAGLLNSCEPDDTTGTDPSDSRNVFVGVWRFTESGYLKNGLSQSYIVSISLDPDNSSQVILDNFGNPGSSDMSVTGIVTTNQIVISNQVLTNGWIVEGSGKKTTEGKMSWSYSITAGGDINYYTATAVKQ